jgi:hypothetical protein
MKKRSDINLQGLFGRHARRPFRILLDENVSPRVRDAIPPAFAQTILMKDGGLKGRDDRALWDWAAAHGIDAILTHDWQMKKKGQDLTLIAIEAARKVIEEANGVPDGARLNRLPLIIHLEKRENPAADLAEIMEKYPAKLARCIDTIRKATISYIHASVSGITPGKSCAEIAYEENELNRRDRSRAEQLETKWRNKIASRHGDAFDAAAMAGLDRQIHAAVAACTPPVRSPQTGPSSRPS